MTEPMLVILIGSPRRAGNSAALAKSVQLGADSILSAALAFGLPSLLVLVRIHI
jgi:hypothetical protein